MQEGYRQPQTKVNPDGSSPLNHPGRGELLAECGGDGFARPPPPPCDPVPRSLTGSGGAPPAFLQLQCRLRPQLTSGWRQSCWPDRLWRPPHSPSLSSPESVPLVCPARRRVGTVWDSRGRRAGGLPAAPGARRCAGGAGNAGGRTRVPGTWRPRHAPRQTHPLAPAQALPGRFRSRGALQRRGRARPVSVDLVISNITYLILCG